ncbi:MAG: laccase domain-containing protein [Mariprofundaceae bacterium]|nr:laccase domain-containing protein [Mariprofundaceae bacterium]
MLHFISSKLFATHQITAVFSERKGGVSTDPFDSLNLGLGLGDDARHIAQNLERLCEAAQLPVPHRSQQIHGTNHLLCYGKGMQHENKADILIGSFKF